jgi:hypothetical protein
VTIAGSMSNSDDDFFKFTTTSAVNVTITLTGGTTPGIDMDLALYNSSGTLIGLSDSTSSNEAITASLQAGATYLCRGLPVQCSRYNVLYAEHSVAQPRRRTPPRS